MSHWNHRVVWRRERIAIHQVHYDDEGKVSAITEKPIVVQAESLKDLKEVIREVTNATRAGPILNWDQAWVGTGAIRLMHSIGTKYYRHNCEDCTWLMSIRIGAKANCYDLYFCTQPPVGPTVVARYGYEAPDYASGVAIAEKISLTELGTVEDALRIAWLVARELGKIGT